MITKACWQAERMLMQSVFPDFKDFGQVEENNVLGFMGTVTGIRTGVCYRVTLFCARSSYPAEPPRVRIYPLPETASCFDEEFGVWDKQSTCATRISQVKRYIDAFDGTCTAASGTEEEHATEKSKNEDLRLPRASAVLLKEFCRRVLGWLCLAALALVSIAFVSVALAAGIGIAILLCLVVCLDRLGGAHVHFEDERCTFHPIYRYLREVER